MEEYFQQSDKEKKDNLPVAPFMDRYCINQDCIDLWKHECIKNRDRVTKPIAQIGFIKYVLLPLFEALSKVCISHHNISILHFTILLKLYPEVEEIALEHLRQALTHYEKKKDHEERKKKFLADPESELETIEAH